MLILVEYKVKQFRTHILGGGQRVLLEVAKGKAGTVVYELVATKFTFLVQSNQNIFGLDIAMHNVVLRQQIQRLCHFDDEMFEVDCVLPHLLIEGFVLDDVFIALA